MVSWGGSTLLQEAEGSPGSRALSRRSFADVCVVHNNPDRSVINICSHCRSE